MDPIFLVKRRRCLTLDEQAEILIKKSSGKITDKELAQQYGVSRETIVRVKKRWSPTVQAAQVYALSKALEVQKERCQAISEAEGKEKYEAATDYLERLDVVRAKIGKTQDSGNKVQIVVGPLAAYGDSHAHAEVDQVALDAERDKARETVRDAVVALEGEYTGDSDKAV